MTSQTPTVPAIAPSLRFVVVAFLLALTGAAPTAFAQQVVISQIYGAGNESGANWRNDYIELFNRGSTPVDLSSWSVQYASDTGTIWSRTNLTGSIPANRYYLIQQSGGVTNGSPLPAPNATGVIAMNATAGKVALVSNQSTLPVQACFTPGSSGVVDFVGYGTTANCMEGAGPAPPPGTFTAVFRGSGGCADTNNNANDFEAFTAAPRNRTSPTNVCSSMRGACCVLGHCTEFTAVECLTVGGTYQGDFTACSVGTYAVTNFPTALEDISADVTVTSIIGLGDNGVTTAEPMPFNFRYFGSPVSNFFITSNGVFAFSLSNTASNNTAFPSPATPNNIISPYWDDLDQLAPSHKIQYVVRDTAPNRRLIVQWTDVPQHGSGQSNTFQIVLFESTNVIEFRYGVVQQQGTGTPAASFNTGFENISGGAGVNIDPVLIGTGGSIAAHQFTPSGSPNCFPPPNNNCADAAPLALGVTASGSTFLATNDGSSICDASGRDVWYTVTTTVPGNNLNVNTCGSSIDTVISVYSGSCGALTQLGCNDDCGGSPCGGTSSCVVIPTLPAGTYFIRVSDKGIAGGGQFSVFATSVVPPPPNDTCSSAIALALDSPVSGTLAGAANDYVLSGAACFTGIGQTASTAPGGDAVYSFTAPDAGAYSFRVLATTSNSNLVLYVASSCPAGSPPVTVSSCLGAANRTTSTSALIAIEEVACLSLSSGQQVFVFVDEHTLSAGSAFVLEVNRCTAEAEANGTPGTANAFAQGIEGAITPANEADFYALGAPAAGSRIFALVDGGAAGVAGPGAATDFDLRVTTATDTLEYDNDNNDNPYGSLSANVAGTPLTGVASYLRVSHSSVLTASEPYRLYAVVQPALALAELESEPNDTIAQADSSAKNYFSGAMSAASDVDLYSFTAAAGDLIILGLDADPLRNNTPTNAALQLLNSSGASLRAVNDAGSSSSTASGAGSLSATTPNSPAEGLVYRATVSGTYYARVSATAAGDYLLSIAVPPCLTIASQPASQTACEGAAASFTVMTSGPPALSYQWRRGTTNLVNGGNISGADTAALTIDPVTASDAGSDYNVVIGTACFGSLTSADASLTVPIPPDEMNPAATPPTSCSGSTVTLSVDDQPDGVIEVDWFSGGGGCVGAPFATGESVMVNPTATTTYYVRARTVNGGCLGDCDSITVTVTPQPTWYDDDDGDGFGDPGDSQQACVQPAGHVANDDDCDDTSAAVNPNATEVCNGIDDDCDSSIDEGFDVDGDGYTICEGDCDDGDPAVNPGATEICNNIDDDCDSSIDEGFDVDGDGYTTCEGDCDDGDPAVNPGATEICNNIDDDCDTLTDEGFDVDGDGYTTCEGDCDDGNPAINPGAAELCNGIDDDCDTLVDEDDTDGDTVPDCGDNCPSVPNPGQEDSDFDGIGDVCDGAIVIIEYPGVDDHPSTSGDIDQRCIHFEFRNCGGVPLPAVFEQVVTFNDGVANVLLPVDCSMYDCLSVRDTKHSLTRTADFSFATTNCTIEFTGSSALVGGNLNGDGHIDILDFGIFSGQYGTTPFEPPCPNGLGFHADISGSPDGSVGAEDFTFIQINFAKASDPACCSPLPEGAGAPPILSITIPELFQLGLGELMVADLNGDGVLDQEDIFTYLSGVEPHPIAVFEGADDIAPSWFDPANWSGGLVPGAASDVGIGTYALIEPDEEGAVAHDVMIVTDGVLEIAAFGALRADVVTVQAGGTLALAGENALLAVKSLRLEAGAIIDWGGGMIDIVGGALTIEDPDLIIGGPGRNRLRLRDGATATIERDLIVGGPNLPGMLSANGSVELDAASLVVGRTIVVGDAGEGRLVLANSAVAKAGGGFVVGQRGWIAGEGSLIGAVSSRGRLQHQGLLSIGGVFEQIRPGTIVFALDPAGQSVLTMEGDASLGGALDVTAPLRMAPRAGDSFELLRARRVVGRFETLHLPPLPRHLQWQIVYAGRAVRLEVIATSPPRPPRQ